MADTFPRCQIVPLPNHETSFEIDGRECLRWHFGEQYPRPFFFPIVGPGGSSLTRMGHPGGANHDHHRSVWFAHQKVTGVDFWRDRTEARIRQPKWLRYEDGGDQAVMATMLTWYDGHDPRPLLEQELIAAIRPDTDRQWQLELQSTFRPTAEILEFGQTNFGFLAVRVAKSISAYFGGGQLTNGEGRQGEPAIFAQRARWVDYSGPVPGDSRSGDSQTGDSQTGGSAAASSIEGITYIDHPQNPGFPSHWHVREDGWMGASVCMKQPVLTSRRQPLVLRYLLDIHRGSIDPSRADRLSEAFASRPPFAVGKATAKHQQFEVQRIENGMTRGGDRSP